MTQYQPYKPQYKEKGITPIQSPAHILPPNTDPTPFTMAFSSKRREAQQAVPPSVSVPYAEPGRPASQLLNVGNNIDNTWSAAQALPSTFGTLEDDTPIDSSQPMIDNNLFVQPPSPQYVVPMRAPLRVEAAQPKTMPDVGDYVLLLAGEVVATGDTKQIQDAAWSLLIESESLPDDIIVMKRVAMNIGVFLAE